MSCDTEVHYQDEGGQEESSLCSSLHYQVIRNDQVVHAATLKERVLPLWLFQNHTGRDRAIPFHVAGWVTYI